jgi:hypothetical protein
LSRDLALFRLSVADLGPEDAPLSNRSLGGRLVFVEGNAKQAQTAILIFPVKLFEQRNLRRADRSIGGPEDQDHGLAAMISQRGTRAI